MNITGVIVYARPAHSALVRENLGGIDGVEVHAITEDGRMVVTVEAPDDGAMTDAFERMNQIPNVLATALVYMHSEALAEEAV